MARGDADTARDRSGRFTVEPETPARYAKALELRAKGLTYRQIAAEIGGGWDAKMAHTAVQKALQITVQEPADQLRQIEVAKLDAAERAVHRVLEAQHFTVSQGRVVYLGDEPLADDAPILAAVDRLIRIAQRRAALLGLDSPVKQELAASVTYEVVGVPTDQLGGGT